ncbi:hypothetical protein [Mycolicibacterium septicum]|uniref:hypothetical protein n=1 Tax=Mycolicibacterium septicum TaxID=98668 RepID=UPI002361D677|nr:hypothetical protein [Mycolicibacterium septicum]
MGPGEGALRIEEGADGLAGTVTVQPIGELALRDLKVDGNELTWSVKGKMPFPITANFTAAIDGDNIRGQMKSKMVNGEFEGTRNVAG